MSAIAPALRASPLGVKSRSRIGLLGDYIALSKPRVLMMVVIAWAIGFDLGSKRTGFGLFDLNFLVSLLGLAGVAAGSSALNQALEHRTDRCMTRTATRPIAAGRISLVHGLTVGLLWVVCGLILIAMGANVLSSALAWLTCAGYVLVYTPLKRSTQLNVLIGALFGALPPLIGWTASRGKIEWPGVALFAILCIWQLPHVIAIGWLNRNDYIQAGVRLPATSTDPETSARCSAIWALVTAAIMIPVSFWPFALHVAGPVYMIIAAGLGLWYFFAALRFARIAKDANAPENRGRALTLLKTSVIYLPILLCALLLCSHPAGPR